MNLKDPTGQTWYDIGDVRRRIDDGIDDLAIKVTQREFNRLLRKFEKDRNYEKYRDKLADIKGYTTNTIPGNFNRMSQNGNGTEVLPGVEVRWHKPNGIPYSDSRILGQWSEGKPTEAMLNKNIYVVHNSTEKYINLTDKSLQREFDRTFRQQPGISNIGPYFSPVADDRWFERFMGIYASAINPFSLPFPLSEIIPLPNALQLFQTPSISETFDYTTIKYYNNLLKYYKQYNIIK